MKTYNSLIIVAISLLVLFPSCEKFELVPLEDRLEMFEWRVQRITQYSNLPDTVTTLEQVITEYYPGSNNWSGYNDNHIIKFSGTTARIYEESTENTWNPDSAYDVTGIYELEDNILEFGSQFDDLFIEEFDLPRELRIFEALSYQGYLNLGASYIYTENGGGILWFNIQLRAIDEDEY